MRTAFHGFQDAGFLRGAVGRVPGACIREDDRDRFLAGSFLRRDQNLSHHGCVLRGGASPPGLISAALAKARIPKRLIVGVLVLLRFFPTVRSSFRRLSESCKRRGVLSAGNVARSPVQALEHALVPLMFSLVDSSDRLSASAIARAAEAPTRRTSYYRSSFGVADAVCLTAVATALAACVWVVRGGWFG